MMCTTATFLQFQALTDKELCPQILAFRKFSDVASDKEVAT